MNYIKDILSSILEGCFIVMYYAFSAFIIIGILFAVFGFVVLSFEKSIMTGILAIVLICSTIIIAER